MKNRKSLVIVIGLLASLTLLGTLGRDSWILPRSTHAAADCSQQAIKIVDLKPTPDPAGGTYYLLPAGWEPLGAGIMSGGTVIRKCLKPQAYDVGTTRH